MIALACALLVLSGAVCGVGLLVVRSFGAYTASQHRAAAAVEQHTMILSESMLLLHQYNGSILNELRRVAALRKDAA